MYFWRIDRLKSELKARDVAPRDILGYVLAYMLLMNLLSLAVYLPSEGTAFTWRDAAFVLASVAILVLGLFATYRANGGAQGRDLAGRLLALSWVLGLRLVALFLPLFTALMIVLIVTAPQPIGQKPPATSLGVLLGFVLLMNACFFWRLAHHLREVNREADNSAAGGGAA